MNVDTGVVRLLSVLELSRLHTAEPPTKTADGFEVLPPHLNRAARRAIAKGGQVDLAGRSKLAAWAREKRSNR